MSFARYPAYKDSGVEWLGEVPGHWEVKRIGHYFNERREKVSDRDFPALSVTKKGIVPQLASAAKSDDGENRKRVAKGDFVINSRSDRKGAAGASELDGSVSLICTVLKPQEQVHTPFVHHLLRCQPFQEEFYRYGKGIVADLWSTNYSEMRNILLGMPPLPEQNQISTFLDIETAKIDGLMAEQRALVALLKEKRQAVISHAVTKGLNPAAPMKDSGVLWLGEVPENWTVTKAGRFLSILSGFAFPSSGFSIDESDTKLLRGINVGISEIKWDQTVYWPRTDNDDLNGFELSAGNIVIGMDRPWISEGVRVARISEKDLPCLLLQRVAALRTFEKLDGDYLFELLSSQVFVNYFSPDTTGVSVPHISPSQISNFLIPIPPLAEQKAIVSFIKYQTAQLDTLTQEAETAIALLQERRTALISAAVTGKMDVRAA